MLDEVDRVVALAGTAEEAFRLGQIAAEAEGRRLEVVLVSDQARNASRAWSPASTKLIIRECPRQNGFPLADADLAWLARHLTRTKLGVALGAGGAKGYAHVGFLQTLEEAGYTVDYVGGSSIGGFVATQLALGFGADEIDTRFREAFSAENTGKLFRSTLVGTAGVEALTGLLKEATKGAFFSHTAIPLVIMAVDLTDRIPVAQRQGPLWEALLAALSVAGVFPTQERDGHRLIDAIALVPVPTAAVIEDGADIVVSVNLLGHRDARELAGRRRRARGRAGQTPQARTARHDARGDGSQPAGHERSPRGARRRRDHAAIRPRRMARLQSRRSLPGRRARGRARADARAAGAGKAGRSRGRSPRDGHHLTTPRRRLAGKCDFGVNLVHGSPAIG